MILANLVWRAPKAPIECFKLSNSALEPAASMYGPLPLRPLAALWCLCRCIFGFMGRARWAPLAGKPPVVLEAKSVTLETCSEE